MLRLGLRDDGRSISLHLNIVVSCSATDRTVAPCPRESARRRRLRSHASVVSGSGWRRLPRNGPQTAAICTAGSNPDRRSYGSGDLLAERAGCELSVRSGQDSETSQYFQLPKIRDSGHQRLFGLDFPAHSSVVRSFEVAADAVEINALGAISDLTLRT
jgi:hypothetical protein